MYFEHLCHTDTAKVNGTSLDAHKSNAPKIYDTTIELGSEPNLRKIPVPKVTSQLNDAIDGFKRSSSPKSPPPPPPTKKSSISSKESQNCIEPEIRKSIESHTRSFKNNKRQIGESAIDNLSQQNVLIIRLNFSLGNLDELMTDNRLHNIRIGSSLYGDLTPIVTTVAPTKMKPDETIGLNDLHQTEPNCSLLDGYNQYSQKDDDKWDKFIECLLFFCCVA